MLDTVFLLGENNHVFLLEGGELVVPRTFPFSGGAPPAIFPFSATPLAPALASPPALGDREEEPVPDEWGFCASSRVEMVYPDSLVFAREELRFALQLSRIFIPNVLRAGRVALRELR